MANTSKTGVKRQVKKAVRRLHPATVTVAVIFLVLGILAGAVACYIFSRDDRFELKGTKRYSLDVGAAGETYLYTEEGVDAVCFGLDVSEKLHTETSLEKNAAGQYVIPLDKEGVYTITYTVDAFKFGKNAPNGEIRRVRSFVVTAAGEEDGRGE